MTLAISKYISATLLVGTVIIIGFTAMVAWYVLLGLMEDQGNA